MAASKRQFPLDALRTGELCPCNWQQGDRTLDAG